MSLLRLCGPLGAAFFLSVGQAADAKPANQDLKFEQVFSARKEPAALHYTVNYQDARGKHELEVWRDGQTRLHRRTDAKLDLFATVQRDGDISIAMLDHDRHMRTDISRSSLYQLGKFSDWFGLAHGINKPVQDYSLQRLAEAPVKQETAFKCQWYKLEVAQHASSVCWSQDYRLPVLIVSAQGEIRWQLASVDQHALPAEAFAIHDKGYIHVDADDDLKAD